MLYENHVPFTIVLDGVLENCLDAASVLVLPGTSCVSDGQVEAITEFVEGGGSVLLLGPAGTRDERTRLRQRYAFEHLFGGSLLDLEHFGPPHWVPQLNFAAMPERRVLAQGRGLPPPASS